MIYCLFIFFFRLSPFFNHFKNDWLHSKVYKFICIRFWCKMLLDFILFIFFVFHLKHSNLPYKNWECYKNLFSFASYGWAHKQNPIPLEVENYYVFFFSLSLFFSVKYLTWKICNPKIGTPFTKTTFFQRCHIKYFWWNKFVNNFDAIFFSRLFQKKSFHFCTKKKHINLFIECNFFYAITMLLAKIGA